MSKYQLIYYDNDRQKVVLDNGKVYNYQSAYKRKWELEKKFNNLDIHVVVKG